MMLILIILIFLFHFRGIYQPFFVNNFYTSLLSPKLAFIFKTGCCFPMLRLPPLGLYFTMWLLPCLFLGFFPLISMLFVLCVFRFFFSFFLSFSFNIGNCLHLGRFKTFKMVQSRCFLIFFRILLAILLF